MDGIGSIRSVPTRREERHEQMENKTVLRLAILIGVLALLGGGGYLLWKLQVGRKAREVVARAERAEEKGDFETAARLYSEHLAVVPGDLDVQLKYADDLIKGERSAARQKDALSNFEDILRLHPGRDDVRRRAAELAFEMNDLERAQSDLAILLKTAKEDGHLEYLMGRCLEQEAQYARAEEHYASAIRHEAPERFEAAQRRAILLRDRLDRKEDADRVIEAMVESGRDDYRAYLGRGRYLAGEGGDGGSRRAAQLGGGAAASALELADFYRALALAPPDRIEVYVEVAGALEREVGTEAAREVLERGLKAAPKSPELYRELAGLEQKAGDIEKAVAVMDRGVQALPEDINLRFQLALLLAGRGEAESGRLRLQIAELERRGAAAPFTQYLTACYHFNRREFFEAEQVLTRLQPSLDRMPDFIKSATNLLLARCYAQTGKVDQQQDATRRALRANENDTAARQAMIRSMIARGDLEGAIGEYRSLYARQPGNAVLPLASLLIDRNRRLPRERRQWDEVRRLIERATELAPAAIEPRLLRARMLLAQDDKDGAYAAMEAIREQFPKDPRAWIALAELLVERRRFDDAQALLDRARQSVGDRVELRLARMPIVVARGGPQAAATLKGLVQDLGSFSADERRQVHSALAIELERLQDFEGASAAWEEVARADRQNLQPRLQLFELAIKANDGEGARGRIAEIEKLDPQMGAFCTAQYKAWEARVATGPAEKEKARAEARGILGELRTRRPDWARVSVALAGLDEDEAAEAGEDAERKKAKIESAIALYHRAIEQGMLEPAVLRRYVQLLFAADRKEEALAFYGQMPGLAQYTGDLTRLALQFALASKDYAQAVEIANKEVEAHPEDFEAREWLARALREGGRSEDAEKALRGGLDADKGSPKRWLALVQFLLQDRQLEKAEQAVRDAEPFLGDRQPSQGEDAAAGPLALARCCEMVGKGFELVEPDRARLWYGRARDWFGRAQKALKDPGDLTVKRLYAKFLLDTNATADAEAAFKELIARTADGKSPDLAIAARRGLAQTYLAAKPPRTAEALALFSARAGTPGDPDDLRVLASIHQAQGTPEGRRLAIEDLRSLLARDGAATPSDRLLLAQLLEAEGDWPGAAEQYIALIRLTDDPRDAEAINRRQIYLELYIAGLLRHHKAGDDTLARAREQLEKLEKLQLAEIKGFRPNPMAVVLIGAQIEKADGRVDEASRRIRDRADRPDVDLAERLRLARAAEAMGLYDTAEAILRRIAKEPAQERTRPLNALALSVFLAHHGRIKEAVDICESLWADPAARQAVASECVPMLCDTTVPADPEQMRRVIGWLEEAAAANPDTMVFIVGQGNLYERLGEYPRAEQIYRRAIKINDRNGIASNNLAWLIALKGGEEKKEALDLINAAIRARGAEPEFLDTRGMIYLLTGQRKLAVNDLEAAFKASPTAPKYFHLAQAYLMLNDREKARKFLEAGKDRGLPGGLHRLEIEQYNKLASDLGRP